MADDLRPLSELVAQGWEVQGFTSAHTGMGLAHTFLLKRQRQHKVLVVSPMAFGRLKSHETEV